MSHKINPKNDYILPTEVHEEHCYHCPSQYSPTPDSEDILTSGNREWILDSEFSCAWRPEKLCKSYHDRVVAAIAQLEKGSV